MTITVRQASSVTVESGTVTALAATLPSAPVSGNIILYLLVVDKSSSTLTAPTGFTARSTTSNANVSGMVASKVSDGSETGAISGSWVTARSAKCVALELQGSGGSSIAFDTASQNYQSTAAAGITTPTLSAGANASLVLVLIGKDSAKSLNTDPDPTESWTNGFATYLEDWSVPTNNGEVALLIGLLTVAGSGSYSTAFSHDGATDQWISCILSFTETGGGGGSAANYYHQQNQ